MTSSMMSAAMQRSRRALAGGAALDEVDFHDVGDERGDAVDVALDAVEGGLAVGRGAGQLDGELEARERRAEFVGDVAEQAALADDQLLQAVGHLIEGAAELPDLVLAPGLDADGEIALAEERDGGGDSCGWARRRRPRPASRARRWRR